MTHFVFSFSGRRVSLRHGRASNACSPRMRLDPPLFLGILSVLSTAACGSEAPIVSLDDVGRAINSVEISQKESEIVVGSVVALEPSTSSPDEAAKLAAERAGKVFSPADCVTAKASGNTVAYELDRCSGPFKSATMSGAFIVVYTTSADELSAFLHAEGLRVGLVTLDIDSEGSYSIDPDGVTRRFEVTTEGSGIGSLGNRIERSGSYTLTWNPVDRCATYDAAFETTVGSRSFRTWVTGFSRCAGACPRAGGEIRYEASARGVGLTIRFDGSTQASWTSTDGASGKIDLFCGAST